MKTLRVPPLREPRPLVFTKTSLRSEKVSNLERRGGSMVSSVENVVFLYETAFAFDDFVSGSVSMHVGSSHCFRREREAWGRFALSKQNRDVVFSMQAAKCTFDRAPPAAPSQREINGANLSIFRSGRASGGDSTRFAFVFNDTYRK